MNDVGSADFIEKAGIGRPLAPESLIACMEAFDRVMPSIVGITLRQVPGVFYVGSEAFTRSNPDINTASRPAVEAKIGKLVTSLCDTGELSNVANEDITLPIQHIVIGDGNRLNMRVNDLPTIDYDEGYRCRGERTRVENALGIPKRAPARTKGGYKPGSYINLGIVKDAHMVSFGRLGAIKHNMNAVRLNRIGLVTSQENITLRRSKS